MKTIDYHRIAVRVLDDNDNDNDNDNDMLTACPIGSYTVIEDSEFYVAARIEEKEAPAIHIDPVPTMDNALDIIVEQTRNPLF